ncbi:preprotein translocase subunit SecE [Wenjunlia vitaminophila]|uniref:Protein translocase subunit SecE n=1 Tax=Wenjunlia vitaminophila TaxID=76728 RepID=A0A0T6LXF0_WENVI|nr:preprotein translocase subunit SecE [Wenjunlia vitaminophila]KRV50798.1 preprotein translocase subunit SecE [Wenjunlia vitaminophila]
MTEALGSTATPERGRPEDQTSPSRRGKRKKKGPLGRMGTFYRQIIAELRKVVWPKRNDLVTYTTVVIVFVVVIIAFVSVLDLGFAKLVEWVFG